MDSQREMEEQGLRPDAEEEEEDEDEEEDEEDEEEHEEGVGEEKPIRKKLRREGSAVDEPSNRKRARPKKKKFVSMFLDEASDEDEDEDEEQVDLEDNLPLDMRRRIEMRHETRYRLDDESAVEIANYFEQKQRDSLRVSYNSSGSQIAGASADSARLIRQRPTTHDPKLFLVHCKPGEERQIVVNVYAKYARDMRRKLEHGNMPQAEQKVKSRFVKPPPPDAQLEIFSVIWPGTTGIIYIEAMKQEEVAAACSEISGLYGSKTRIVPINEMTDVLNVEIRKQVIRKGDWVRLKVAPYKGDLAQVFAVEGGGKCVIKVVPRIDIAAIASDAQKVSNKRSNASRSKVIPPAKLFNPEEVRAAGGMVTRELYEKTSEVLDNFDDRFFKDGLMYMEISEKHLSNIGVNAKVEELRQFTDDGKSRGKGDVSIGEHDIQRVVNATSSKSKFDFTVGDLVLVVGGSEAGLTGQVAEVNLIAKTATLSNIKSGNTASTLSKMEVPLSNIVKTFSMGDHVRVVTGIHKGKLGWVSQVVPFTTGNPNPSVSVFIEETKSEVQVSNSDLKKSNEAAVGLTTLDGYNMYDLVMLDQNQHAIIVKINEDGVRVLTQAGDAKDIPTASIRAKKNVESKNASVPDKKNMTLRIDSSVTVVSGPYQGLEGVVKHIHRALVFLHCKKRETENAGIIVAMGRDLAMRGVSSQAIKNSKSMQPPNAHYAGQSGSRGPRDELVGKTVRIRQGEMKGQTGIVVEGTSGKTVRVELQAREKCVTVSRNAIIVETRIQEQPSIPNYESNYGDTSHTKEPQTPFNYSDQSKPPNSQVVLGEAVESFSPEEQVKLLDTGEEVTIFRVIDKREVLIKDKDGAYRIEKAANLVHA